MTARLLAALVALAALAFAPAPFLKKAHPPDDPAALDGLWEALTIERTTGVSKNKGNSFARFAGETLTFVKEPNATAGISYRIAVDAKARPATLDLHRPAAAKGAGTAAPFLGRYRIEGDRLYFNYGHMGRPRPEGLKPANADQALMTFRRVNDPLKGVKK